MKIKNNFAFVLTLLVALTLLLNACGGAATPEATAAPQETAALQKTAAPVATEPPTPTEKPTQPPPPTAEPTKPPEPVTITYWHTMSDPETAQLDKVIAAF